jgi:hypothetical protein
MLTTRPPETDVYLPLPRDGERWDAHTVHTHYFSLSVPEAELGAHVYVRYQPASSTSQAGVFVFRGNDNIDPLDIEYTDYQITMGWPEVTGNRIRTDNELTLDFLEPGRVVRVSYESPDGRTSLDVMQTAVTPLLARGHIVPGEELQTGHAVTPGGSEQLMHCVGEITVNGERYAIDCYAARDRSWGQLRYETPRHVPPAGWSPMYWGEDLAFNQVSYESADCNPAWAGIYDVDPKAPAHYFGWAIVDGTVRGLRRVRRNVLEHHPSLHVAMRQEIEAEDDLGDVYRFTGNSIAMAPLLAWPNVALRVGVYRWQDERGRVTHDTYQEMFWDNAFQRARRAFARNSEVVA